MLAQLTIPPLKSDVFLTLAEIRQRWQEIVRDHPATFRHEVIGESADGRDIDLITAGSGSKSSLLVGVPHPNEPIGALTVLQLLRALAETPEWLSDNDRTVAFIPVADPDGLSLNEGWFKQPQSPLTYALNFYRPPSSEQVEWSFPIDYKDLHFNTPAPETSAVMAAIDKLHPDDLFSLHNSAFGGAYFYTSNREPAFHDALRAAVAQTSVPLHRGEPEAPYVEVFSPAVHRILSATGHYDFMVDQGADISQMGGGGSWDYLQARCPGAQILVCEVPYFTAPALSDESASGLTRRQAGLQGLAERRKVMSKLADAFQQVQADAPHDRLWRAVRWYVDYMTSTIDAEASDLASEQYAQPATGSQAFDAVACRTFYNLLFVGIARRVALGVGNHGLADELERVIATTLDDVCHAGEMRPLPLADLVGVQVAAWMAMVG